MLGLGGLGGFEGSPLELPATGCTGKTIDPREQLPLHPVARSSTGYLYQAIDPPSHLWNSLPLGEKSSIGSVFGLVQHSCSYVSSLRNSLPLYVGRADWVCLCASSMWNSLVLPGVLEKPCTLQCSLHAFI